MSSIDRSTYAQHEALRCEHFPGGGDYFALLAQTYETAQRHARAQLAPALGSPLSPWGMAQANRWLEEIDRGLHGELQTVAGSPASRERGAALLGRRLDPGATLEELLALDSFHGVLPFFDGPALAWLTRTVEIPAEAQTELRDTIRHRVLHGPQRTRYIFFHELAVGHYLELLEQRAPLARGHLRLTVDHYAAVPAYCLRVMAQHLGLSVAELAALHFETNEALEARLPPAVRELLALAAHLYFALELLFVYVWKIRNGALIERVIQFFVLPSLERLRHEPGLRLRADAGALVAEALTEGLCMEADANEVDAVQRLVRLTDAVWHPAHDG
jgi:hypothetical protein